MPRKRVLKTNRAFLDENNIRQALISIFNGTYTERRAAIVFNIKRTTIQSRKKNILARESKEEFLRRHLGNYNDSGNETDNDDSPKYSSKYTVRQVFTNEQELELEKYVKRCSDINYGLTYTNLQKLAYEYALALPNCRIPQEWHDKAEAKEGWRRGFMARHKSLSLRKPESTSLSRSTAFNKHKVEQFFEKYMSVMNRFKFSPERIYNLDETGVTTVMKPVKVVTTSGKKQVCQVASAERGDLVTFVGIINAIGQSLPPAYVLPRIRNLDDFAVGAPPSSIILGNKSGWMTGPLFLTVLKHIVAQTQCTVGNPILLLIDNHESHVSVNSVRYCKENGICLLSFPPHTTHRLQPLDVGVYGPFKSYCNIVFNDWLTSNPGKTISVKNIPSLTKDAYLRAFTAGNITSSFKKTGLWPINRLVFADEDFSPSYVTDRPLPINPEVDDNKAEEINQRDEQVPDCNADTSKFIDPPSTPKIIKEHESAKIVVHSVTIFKPNNDIHYAMPSCSNAANNKNVQITPEMVRPYPKISTKRVNKSRQPGISRVYTDTPEKERLEKIESERELKKKKTVSRKLVREEKMEEDKRKKKKKRKYSEVESTSSSEEEFVLNDNSEDDLSEEFENLEDIKDQELEEKNFVLVRFPVKNSMIHFVGQILNKENNLLTIKFLRRKCLSTTFYYPEIDDIAEVDIEDVVAKLTPSLRAATARRTSVLNFCYYFDNLLVK